LYDYHKNSATISDLKLTVNRAVGW
jgi:hypothetical protein